MTSGINMDKHVWGCVPLGGYLSGTFLPPSLNIFRAMGESSPLFTHMFPWASMAFSLGRRGDSVFSCDESGANARVLRGVVRCYVAVALCCHVERYSP